MSFFRLVFTISTIFALCSGQATEQVTCRAQPQRRYTTADRAESMVTDSIQEESYILSPESGKWCDNPANKKFRTFDGTCNHPNNLGASSKPIDSLLPPDYDDGIGAPRVRGVNGEALPSARNVSLKIHKDTDVFASFPIILMQWGQWIAHDIIATAVTAGNVRCCGVNGGCPPFVTNRNCFPIQLPSEENHFPGTCLEFVRSMPYSEMYNSSVPRQQINSATSFLDASQIYGSNDISAEAVREPNSFLLRTKNENFLPESLESRCIKTLPHHYCFLAGDFRVNQHPYLGALNTIWVREHNRIARRLRVVKSSLSDEEIFQRTRKIIIALHQIITFNAYLPIILGDDATRYDLTSTKGRSAYNPGHNPSVYSAFSTAAFRFGHSTVPRIFPIGRRLLQLRDIFNKPGEVIDNFDDVVAGMVGVSGANESRIQTADRNFVPDISKFLFMNPTTGRGLDLVSINIQRGRDHGLPSYTKWRSFCGLRPLTGFDDIEALGPFVSELGQLYKSVDDIDLYTGMLHEPVRKGLVGSTIRCLLRIQFFRLKFGDRFFFDNDEPQSAFTDLQLTQLRGVTLAEIFCRNTNLQQLPINVFMFQSSKNPMMDCANMREYDIDLSVF